MNHRFTNYVNYNDIKDYILIKLKEYEVYNGKIEGVTYIENTIGYWISEYIEKLGYLNNMLVDNFGIFKAIELYNEIHNFNHMFGLNELDDYKKLTRIVLMELYNNEYNNKTIYYEFVILEGIINL